MGVWTNGESISFYHRKDPNFFEDIPDIPKENQKLKDILKERWTIAELIAKDKLLTENKSLSNLIREMEDEVLANAGVDVFEEVFKLIYTKLYDEMMSGRDESRVLEFRNYGDTDSDLKEIIQKLFDSAKNKWRGVFAADDKIKLTPSHLAVCVSSLQNVKLFNSNLEVIDEAFEYLMSKSQKGAKGQYFTPRYVIDMCVKMLNPKKSEKMIDTAAGSCGFPVHTIFRQENFFARRSQKSKKFLGGHMKYYSEKNLVLFLDDTFERLEKLSPESVDMIFADPPYFLSNGGFSVQGGKRVSVNKGDWDKGENFEDKHNFNRQWLKLAKKILKPNGTIWISGTLHNIFSVGVALEQEGYKILNNITWQKTNPPPNLSCRYFTHSTETILWARKNGKNSRHLFNYELMKEMNGGKQMKDVWTGNLTSQKEKIHGKHPTQKPLYLLKKIILASTQENDIVLDPFCGSSTTGVACKLLKRKFIGIDNNEDFLKLSIERLINADENKDF